ncbi:MAG TPA: hypothetical protein VJN64_11390 [Terriglobales bacterium]|nr:hypothetical protein [Terriglobales bacterium]
MVKRNATSILIFLSALLTLLSLGASAQQPAASPQPQESEAQRNQQKARTWLDQMIQALGGQAYLTLQDSFTRARYGRFHNEVLVGGTISYRYWKWPDEERNELTEQRDVVELYLSDKAYEVTFRGSRELDPQKDENLKEILTRRHFALDHILRQWINQPGTLLLDEGPTLAANKMTEKITVINSKDQAVSILISPDTHLPVQKTFIVRDPQTHDRDEEDEIYDNWRMVQGVNTPYSVVIQRNGQIARQTYLLDVSYNIHPPASYFTPILINREKEIRKK